MAIIPTFGAFARALVEERNFVVPPPIGYRTWGTEIDDAAHAQMRQSCRVPVARRAALMPDAHVGYGLPIGGVLACENAVIPYAVGVDIACRMKLSVFDLPIMAARTTGSTCSGTRSSMEPVSASAACTSGRSGIR